MCGAALALELRGWKYKIMHDVLQELQKRMGKKAIPAGHTDLTLS